MSSNIIPSAAPSVYAQLSKLDSAAIVRPNNPPAGIAGFLFHVDGDQSIRLRSMITRHTVEDNTTIQDNIALLPEEVSLKGLIAELTDSGSNDQAISPPVQPLPLFPGLFPSYAAEANISFSKRVGALVVSAGTTLTLGKNGLSAGVDLGGSIGPLSANAIVQTTTKELADVLPPSVEVQVAIAAAVQNAVGLVAGGNAPTSGAIAAAIQAAVGNVVGAGLSPSIEELIAQSVNSSLGTTIAGNASPDAASTASLYQYYASRAPSGKGQSAQSVAFGFFYQMWKGRQLFSVETPWGVLNDMAIAAVDVEQGEESKYISNFTITFERIRIAQSVTVNPGQLAGRNLIQASASAPTQGGNPATTPVTAAQYQSALSWLAGGSGPLAGFLGGPAK